MNGTGTPQFTRAGSVRQWAAWCLAVYLVIWGMATHLPRLPEPSGPGGWWDKPAHFAGYFGLALLGWWNSAHLPRSARIPLLFLLLAGIGAVDEWTQGFVPGRSPEWHDWLADLWGAAAGLAAASRFLR